MSLTKITVVALLAGLLSLTGNSLRAAEPLAGKVQTAIDRGVGYLKKTQVKDGDDWNWEKSNILTAAFSGGTTCLATLALLNSGVPVNDPIMQRTLPFIRKLKPKLTDTLALQNLVLAEVGEAKDLKIIQRNAELLLAGRVYNYDDKKLMGWTYSKNSGFQSGPPADNSNSHYAIMGLLAARQAGAKFWERDRLEGVKFTEKDWLEIQKFYIDSQILSIKGRESGGWPYQQNRGAPTHTMTVAGLSGLLIASRELNSDKQKLDEKTGVAHNCGKYEENQVVARGLRWLGDNFKFDLSKEIQSPTFYHFYGLERLGRISGQRLIGGHDWYREGCELLCGLKKSELNQADDGSWRLENSIDNMPVLSTSFALMFLAKGRTPVLINKLAFDSNEGSSGWNRKHDDARHLVEYASKSLFANKQLAWQVFDPRIPDLTNLDEFNEELQSLAAAPILYMTGHTALNLTPRQIELLRRYIDGGGFIFAEACCGDPAFTDGFAKLMEKVFKDKAKLARLPLEHPIWSARTKLDPAEFTRGRAAKDQVQFVELGKRTAVVFTPQPLAGFWEESRFMPPKDQPPANRGELAYRFAGNVIAHATGLKMPKPRLANVEAKQTAASDAKKTESKPSDVPPREPKREVPTPKKSGPERLNVLPREARVETKEPPQLPPQQPAVVAPRITREKSNAYSQQAPVQRPVFALAPGNEPKRETDEFSQAITMPLPMLYLDVAAVRAELKLSKDQAAKLDKLSADWTAGAMAEKFGFDDSPALPEKLKKAVVKEIDGILSAEQRKRLQQIMVRHRVKEYGMPAVLAVLARDLGLSSEQHEKHQRLYFKRAEIVLEHITGGDPLQDIRRNVYLANTEYVEKFEALLTAAQQAKLQDLLGEPFTADIQLKTPATINLGGRPTVYVSELFDHHTFEPEFLVNETVQKELKMSGLQNRKAQDFLRDWNTLVDKEIEARRGNPLFNNAREIAVDALRTMDVRVFYYLRDLLNAEQQQRFREIMMQHRRRKAGLAGVCSYPRFPGLTALQALEIQKGGNPHDLLDKEQLAKLQQALGKPFTAEVKYNDRGIFEQPPKKNARPAVARPTVDLKQITLAGFILDNGRRLNLTKEQSARLRELAEDAPKLRAILHKELSQLPPPAELGGARNNLPEVRAHETLRKALRGQSLDVLDKQQQSLLQNLLRKSSARFDP